MPPAHRASVVPMARPRQMLTDERIAQVLSDAFAPHRCTAEFQDDRRKVALRVRGPTGAEFVIEGQRLELLRDMEALAQYIHDVRIQLGRHRLRFYVQPDWASTNVDRATTVVDDRRIDVENWNDVRYWSRKLGCTQSVLRAAVNVLGPRVKDVEPYVKRRRPR